MALHTGRAGRAGQGIGGVQAMVAINLRGNFAVALSTSERRGARGNRVTLGAVGRAVEALVRLGKRAGRDLAVK